MPDLLKSSPSVKRWVTGILVGLPVLVCIAAGPIWSWWLLVSLATTIGLWELHGLLFHVSLSGKWRFFSFAAGLFLPFATYLWGISGLNFALFVSFFAALCLMMISSPLDCDEISRIALLSFAWLYVPYFISFVLLIGRAPQGRFWILFLLVVIVAGDACAYHTGRWIGRHKLYRAVSPMKTIEGAIGGLFLSIVAGSIFGFIFLRNMPLAKLFFFSLAVAATGQVGDLIESMIKRNSGKKDSSGLLPGHGGILDRLDSLIFAFPVLWALLQWAPPG
ncbi:MAG TPA: phosphatidate cytidylyltransferase [Deltaproteobacteria bacterium]|jgi:phosphatidate cytidylyltransferase|nr:phosphatidate cytidylyltransferase [Deltaproteobacteria bacterium]